MRIGITNNRTALCTDGEIVEIGHDVYNYGYAVRPVIWIDLDTTETDLYHPIYTPEE